MTRRMTAAEYRRLIPEASLQATVTAMAARLGWWAWHDTDSRKNKAGLPDLLLIRPPRVVFAELKREGEKLRPAQVRVMGLLAACPHVESYVWRPSDLPDIERILAGRDVPPSRPNSTEGG